MIRYTIVISEVDRMKEKMIYTLLLLFAYVLLGVLIDNTGSGMVILLVLMPLLTLLVSFFYGCKKGFDYMIPILTMLAFVPILYGFLNSSALIYLLVYGIISLLANYAGGLFGRWIHSEKRKG